MACGALTGVARRGGQLGHSAGQMREMHETGYRTNYLRFADAGHLVHDKAPQVYRQAVESFL